MTHRELLNMAMPLISLTNEQWELISEHLAKQKGELAETLNIIISNQAKIEITENYNEYYFDKE